ncbi:MAG: PilZ domain-containing protein [Magnetococcales bacterium]|nr:PilZ domain-containing protein [Magnetococcales bacterium]
MTVRRRHERVAFSGRAVLTLPDGTVCAGSTRDVSLHGLFLVLPEIPVAVVHGCQGVLRLTELHHQREFQCRVVHVAPQGLGIELQDQSITFGSDLTGSMLRETRFQVGVTIPPGGDVPVTLRRAGAEMVRAYLLKISISRMECVIPVHSAPLPGPGERLAWRIEPAAHAPIEGEGELRSAREHGAEKVCLVVFPVLAEETRRAVEGLIQRLSDHQAQRGLAGIANPPPARFAAAQSRQIKQVLKEFEGVFGKSKS